MFLVLFAVSVVCLRFCYDESFVNIAYCAVAAYTIRHMAFQFYSLYLTLLSDSGTVANGVYSQSDFVFSSNSWLTIVSYLCCYFVLYVLCYTFFVKLIAKNGEFVLKKPSLLIWVIIILFIDIVLNAVVVYNSNDKNFLNDTVLYVNVITTYLYNILCCFFTLFIQYIMLDVQKLKKELEITNHIWQQERKQYEISKENVDLINRKCHDLKYQVAQIVVEGGASGKTAQEVKRLIDIYDGMLKTGNEALDVIFAEKSLLCTKNDVKLNCMIDGAKISFMETADVYVLFGNLIDNAMDAVQKLQEADKRFISVNVYAEDKNLNIVVSNYYNGAIDFGSDGLPITTKTNKEYHGIGTRSVSLIVDRYGGAIQFLSEETVFTVEITIPIPN